MDVYIFFQTFSLDLGLVNLQWKPNLETQTSLIVDCPI